MGTDLSAKALSLSLALSSPRGNERPKANPEAARQPLLTSEAVEQPNSNPVWRRAAETMNGAATGVVCAPGRHGGFREGCRVGASRSAAIFAACPGQRLAKSSTFVA